MLLVGVVLSLTGVCLLTNALVKVVRFETFVAAVAKYAPAARPALVAGAWAVTEVAAGAVLISPLALRAVPATWLLGAATGGLVRRVTQGEDHDCGCSAKRRKISPGVVRNNVMLIGFLLAAQWLWGGAATFAAAALGAIALAPIAFLGVGSRTRPADASAPA